MSDFQLGRHEQAIELLLEGQTRVEKSIENITKQLAEMRGERRASLWWMSSGAAVLGSILTIVVDRVFK